MTDYYIGLMSGTSFDGVDAVIASFEKSVNMLAHSYLPYDSALREQLLALSIPNSLHSLETVFELDALLGDVNAKAVQTVLKKAGIRADQIRAVGLHGQTLRHCPDHQPPFTTQLGDPNCIVAAIGIPTVADFRRKDIALNGQGAPLAPLFHQAFFASPTEDRAIINIGGFANIALLQKDTVWGFDTGPGNVFIDALARQHLQKEYDDNGACARLGTVHETSLKQLRAHPFFHATPPKSTGRDMFDDTWFTKATASMQGQPTETWLATLTELTAQSIAEAILQAAPTTQAVYVCGGGAKNAYLMERLQANLPNQKVDQTTALGVAPEYVEACLMAWLARQRVMESPVDLREITGSREAAVLGALYV